MDHGRRYRHNLDQTQEQIDRFLSVFDERQREQKRRSQQVDDDGWTTVDHGHRRPMVQVDALESQQQQRSKKRLKQAASHLHLYKFQEREQKQKRLEQLRERFEADKAKLRVMQQQRAFKPFG